VKHFRVDEFECPCCHQQHMHPRFLERLDTARDISGVPYHINSGWRCVNHNREVGGGDKSAHLVGLACDIRATESRQRFHILRGLFAAGFARIGVGNGFIHCDDDREKESAVAWTYYGG
jgi:hypothetical protein